MIPLLEKMVLKKGQKIGPISAVNAGHVIVKLQQSVASAVCFS
jgi:hypothetical protein